MAEYFVRVSHSSRRRRVGVREELHRRAGGREEEVVRDFCSEDRKSPGHKKKRRARQEAGVLLFPDFHISFLSANHRQKDHKSTCIVTSSTDSSLK